MSDPQPTTSGPADQALRLRARRVVPGGMSGHLNAAALPAGYPQFFQRGEGCRLWDVDGREFIDFMCGWGPNLLGWQHPEVEAAARTQAALGDCLNGPTPRFVELAEALVDTIAHADWVLFQKLRDAATRIFTTGSFWAGGVAMAAALATLAVARRDGLVAHLERVGGLFRQGLAEQATSLGVHIRQSGPVQMPLVLFDDDPAFAKGNAFCAEALRHGVYLHPKHNMFLSAAHTEADIAQALRATEAGLQAVRQRFGEG